jgi:hypothetical protein
MIKSGYLDIPGPVLLVTCKAVADMIKGKAPDEMRKTFHLKTPESCQWADSYRFMNALYEKGAR